MAVLAFITDLFFQAKVGETARQVGVELKMVDTLYKFFPALSPNIRLVLIDLNAERISGSALISQIKASHPGLPVVAFAAHVEKDRIEAAQQAGADEVLPRSDFSRRLPEILRQAAGEEASD